MLQSMTGFGRAKIETEQYTFLAEVKTLNSKSADISIRLPRRFSDKEIELRNKVAAILDRGKINVSIDFEPKAQGQESKTQINKELAKQYFNELKSFAGSIGTIDDQTIFAQVLRMQGVIEETKEQEVSEDETKNLLLLVDHALTECKNFRADEGKVLHETLKGYILQIVSLLENVKAQDPLRVEAVRARIEAHFQEISASEMFDKNRFEQEMIFYIEKLDISEEKVRLANHLEYFIGTMEKEEFPGRKLGFISQEIGREINTIGSKANDVVIQKLVVEMKDHLEKIKEQSLNVL
jgi:uncharacterized protein (TIGR00255 family)